MTMTYYDALCIAIKFHLLRRLCLLYYVDVIHVGNGRLDFEEFKDMMAKQLNPFDSYYDVFKGIHYAHVRTCS